MYSLRIIPVLFLGLLGFGLLAEARTPLEPTMCTMQYQPVCGAKEVQCVRAPCYPQYETYGNACVMSAEGATLVHEGECTAEETGPVTTKPYVPPAHCKAWFDGCNHCGRGANGESYCTLMACAGDPAPGYCTAYDEPVADVPREPAPAQPEPVATTAVSVEVDVQQGFFESLWEQIQGFFRSLF